MRTGISKRDRQRRYTARTNAPTQLAGAMTEDELLEGLTDALTYCGWRWMHLRRSDLAIVQGHAGWPDIVAVRGDRLLTLELKREDGKVTLEQIGWLERLQHVDGVEAAIVRPSTYDATLELIR